MSGATPNPAPGSNGPSASTQAGGTSVVATAGRRIDAADAAIERFPLRMREHVRRALEARLASERAVVHVSSAACGTDLLAHEAARALGLRRRVVIPCAVARFRELSVVDRPGDWGPVFDQLIEDVAASGDLIVLDVGEGDAAYRATNLAILREGEALAGAGHRKAALLVWDGASRGPDDLTDHFRREAEGRGWAVGEVLTR